MLAHNYLDTRANITHAIECLDDTLFYDAEVEYVSSRNSEAEIFYDPCDYEEDNSQPGIDRHESVEACLLQMSRSLTQGSAGGSVRNIYNVHHVIETVGNVKNSGQNDDQQSSDNNINNSNNENKNNSPTNETSSDSKSRFTDVRENMTFAFVRAMVNPGSCNCCHQQRVGSVQPDDSLITTLEAVQNQLSKTKPIKKPKETNELAEQPIDDSSSVSSLR